MEFSEWEQHDTTWAYKEEMVPIENYRGPFNIHSTIFDNHTLLFVERVAADLYKRTKDGARVGKTIQFFCEWNSHKKKKGSKWMAELLIGDGDTLKRQAAAFKAADGSML